MFTFGIASSSSTTDGDACSCFKRRLQVGDDSSGSASMHRYCYQHSTGRLHRH